MKLMIYKYFEKLQVDQYNCHNDFYNIDLLSLRYFFANDLVLIPFCQLNINY